MNKIDELIKHLKDLEEGKLAYFPLENVGKFCRKERELNNAVPFLIVETIINFLSNEVDGLLYTIDSINLFNQYIKPLISCFEKIKEDPSNSGSYLSEYIVKHYDKK